MSPKMTISNHFVENKMNRILCVDTWKKKRLHNFKSDSVTRFGKILPLWKNFLKSLEMFEGTFILYSAPFLTFFAKQFLTTFLYVSVL